MSDYDNGNGSDISYGVRKIITEPLVISPINKIEGVVDATENIVNNLIKGTVDGTIKVISIPVEMVVDVVKNTSGLLNKFSNKKPAMNNSNSNMMEGSRKRNSRKRNYRKRNSRKRNSRKRNSRKRKSACKL